MSETENRPIRKVVIVLVMLFGLGLAVFPDAVALVGLSVSPGDSPNFSDRTHLAETYKGYEIWLDPARDESGRGGYIIYTPPGVTPVVSSIKFELEAARNTINYYINEYNTPPPSPPPQYTITFIAEVGGTIEPSGSFTYNKDTQVWVKATPDPGYEFNMLTQDPHQTKGGEDVYSFDPSRTCVATHSFTVKAYFIALETPDPSDTTPPNTDPGDGNDAPSDPDPPDDLDDQVDEHAEGLPPLVVSGFGIVVAVSSVYAGRKEFFQ